VPMVPVVMGLCPTLALGLAEERKRGGCNIQLNLANVPVWSGSLQRLGK